MAGKRGKQEEGADAGAARTDSESAAAPDPGPPAAGGEPARINFTTFIFSLSSSALIQLGEIPDPFTQKVEKNLTAAHQTIDILGLLEQKTKGNLDDDEGQTLEAILYDLRMRFLKASGRL